MNSTEPELDGAIVTDPIAATESQRLSASHRVDARNTLSIERLSAFGRLMHRLIAYNNRLPDAPKHAAVELFD